MLSVSVVLLVVLSVSVERAMECQMRVHELFCAVSLSGMMQSTISVLSEKTVS